MLRIHYTAARSAVPQWVNFLLLGLALVFLGVSLIVGCIIAAASFFVSQYPAIIYEDIGPTLSACGCTIAAFSFLNFRLYET